MIKHVFLTGPPGVGKTTLIQKVCDAMKSAEVNLNGFYTEEVRAGGRRVGFDVVTVSGERAPLSRVGNESGASAGRREYKVGQYVVDLPSFENLALPLFRQEAYGELLSEIELPVMEQIEELYSSILERNIGLTGYKVGGGPGGDSQVFVIDEIGKMELFSQAFIRAVRQTLDCSFVSILGTIPIPKGKPLGLVEEVRGRADVKVFTISKENRNTILPAIVDTLQKCLKQGP